MTTAEFTHALELNRSMLTVDTHCDTPGSLTLRGYDIHARHDAATLLGGDVDLPRMRAGGLAASFFAVFVAQGPRTPEGFAQAWESAQATFGRLETMFRAFPDDCAPALTPGDAAPIRASGRRAIFLGMENGHPLGLDLDRLDQCFQRGARYLTLCHADDNELCASCTSCGGWGDAPMTARATADTGLTEFGARVVERMNRLGMMVDVSHVSERTVDEVLALSRAPVLASHSGALALCGHPRNIPDRQLRAIAAKGGVVQVCFVPRFVKAITPDPEGEKAHNRLRARVRAHYAQAAIGADPAVDAAFEAEHRELCRLHPPYKVKVADVADHIDHVARVAGIEHVGIGGDWDGGARMEDCRDVAELPALTAELVRRGYTEDDLRRIWGGNVMRVLGEALAMAGEA
jgi:membrane dipeptidase